jgi:seryl-tRNA synthetase
VLDIRLLRESPEAVRDSMRRRGKLEALAPVLDRFEAVDRERRQLIQATDELKARRNAASQEVARRKRAGDDAAELIAQTRTLGDDIASRERELGAREEELQGILYELPNVLLREVPEGGEEDGVIVSSWGEPRARESVRPHWEVGATLGLIDLERASKVSGSGFVFYRRGGARLVRALISFFMDLHAREHGYEEVWPPDLVSRATMTGTGQLPKFEEDMYATRDDGLYLIPTAEVPVTNLYRDEILPESALPMAFVAYSKCFRREAGSAGKDTRGVLRTHEFDKVELVRYTTPESSPEQLELLTSHAETALRLLGLPHRRKLLAAGDTGFSSAKTYDLEAWAPGVGAWLEVSSCSTFTDFQARRASIRYRPADGGKPRLVHTLNGSGLALPRVVAVLLEHHQRADGTVCVPDALRPYVGADVIA